MRKHFLTTLAEDMKAIGLTQLLNENADDGEADDDLDEAKVVKLKKQTSAERAAGRRAYRANKSQIRRASRKRRKTAKFKRRQKKLARLHKGGRTAGTRKRFSTEGKVYDPRALLDEGRKVADSIAESSVRDQVRAFAHLALAADALKVNLEEASEDVENDDLGDAIEEMENLSFETADIADALKRGKQFEGSDLEEAFQEGLSYLVDGLEYYDALLDERCDDDDHDDEDEDEEDDEEEDVEEEAVAPSKKGRRK